MPGSRTSSPVKRRASEPVLGLSMHELYNKQVDWEKRLNNLEKKTEKNHKLLKEKVNKSTALVIDVMDKAKQIIAQNSSNNSVPSQQPQAQEEFTQKLAKLAEAQQGLEAKTTGLEESLRQQAKDIIVQNSSVNSVPSQQPQAQPDFKERLEKLEELAKDLQDLAAKTTGLEESLRQHDAALAEAKQQAEKLTTEHDAALQDLEAKTTKLTEAQKEFKFAFTSSNNQLRFMLLDFVLCFLSVVVLDEPIIMQFIKQYVAMPAMAIKLSAFALITGVVLITYSIKPDLLGGNVVVYPSKDNGTGGETISPVNKISLIKQKGLQFK